MTNRSRYEAPEEGQEADVGNRTPDLLITSELLCQLSYVGPKQKPGRLERHAASRDGDDTANKSSHPGEGLV